jgi:hypothetical protein
MSEERGGIKFFLQLHLVICCLYNNKKCLLIRGFLYGYANLLINMLWSFFFFLGVLKSVQILYKRENCF